MSEQVGLDVLMDADDFKRDSQQVSRLLDKMAKRFRAFDRTSNLGTSGLNRLGQGGMRASSGLNASHGALGKMTGALSMVAGPLASFGTWLLNIGKWAAIGFAAATTAAVAFFAKMTYHAAGMRAKFIRAFGALRGGSGAAEWQKIKDLSLEMATPLEDTAEAMLSLTTAGFSRDQSTRLFKYSQDMAALGASAEEVKGAIRAITQIEAAGVLQGDELNQLAEAKVGKKEVWAELGKQLGKDQQEIKKLAQSGKISSDQAIAAIEAVISERTGMAAGEFAKMESVSGSLGKVKALWDNFMDTVAGAATPAFKLIGKIADEMSVAFQSDDAVDWATTIGDAFNVAAGAVEMLWKVGKQLFAGFAEGMDDGGLEKINQALAMLGDSETDLKGLGDLFKVIGRGTAEATVFLVQYIAVVMAFWAWVSRVAGAVREWQENLRGVGEAGTAGVNSILESVGGLPAQLLTMGTNAANGLIDGLANGISAGVGRVKSAVQEVSGGMMGSLNSFWKFGSPSKVTRGKGQDLGKGLVLGTEDMRPEVQRAMVAMTADLGAGDRRALQAERGISAPPPMDFSALAGMFATGGGGGGEGGKEVTINVDIHVDGAGGDADAEWERLRPRVRREIEVGLRTAGEM